MSKLYEVSFINQETGDANSKYVVAESLIVIENEFADITNIVVMGEVEVLS